MLRRDYLCLGLLLLSLSIVAAEPSAGAPVLNPGQARTSSIAPEGAEPGYFSAEIALPEIAAQPPKSDLIIVLRDCSLSMTPALPVPKIPDAPQQYLIDFDLYAAAPIELKPGQKLPAASLDGATDIAAGLQAAAGLLKEK